MPLILQIQKKYKQVSLSLEHLVRHAFYCISDDYSVFLKSSVPSHHAVYTLFMNYSFRDSLRASYHAWYRLISAYTQLLFIEVLSAGPIEATSIIQKGSCCRQEQIKSSSCNRATTEAAGLLTANA